MEARWFFAALMLAAGLALCAALIVSGVRARYAINRTPNCDAGRHRWKRWRRVVDGFYTLPLQVRSCRDCGLEQERRVERAKKEAP
jgi:hypothetical protein